MDFLYYMEHFTFNKKSEETNIKRVFDILYYKTSLPWPNNNEWIGALECIEEGTINVRSTPIVYDNLWDGHWA